MALELLSADSAVTYVTFFVAIQFYDGVCLIEPAILQWSLTPQYVAVMKAQIYVRLLNNEGVDVWKAVPAIRVAGNVYALEGDDIFDPTAEEWEFEPGAIVIVEERKLPGAAGTPEKRLVAVGHHDEFADS